MAYVFSTPAGLITLFALGIEAALAVVLAFATGLSEMHKDLLVGFAVGFPTLMLVLILVLLQQGRAEAGVTSLEEP